MMSTTRRLAVAALFLAAFAGQPAAAGDWRKIRIGIEGAYPPFSETDPDGRIRGFDVDIADALCRQIRAECELVRQDWDGIIPNLLARRYDAVISSMSISEERRQRLDFTDKYYQIPARFVRRKGSGIEINDAALKGRRVGVQRATVHDSFLTDRYGDIADIRRYATQDQIINDLLAGRLDLMVADSVAASEELLKTEAGQSFEFVGPPFSEKVWFGEGMGIAVRKEDQDLKQLFNRALREIRANGVYDLIARRYFDFDIYGS